MAKLGFDELFMAVVGGSHGICVPVHTSVTLVVMFIMGNKVRIMASEDSARFSSHTQNN